jgi:uncharacterized membrane protein YgdD (TMEM256/DUF423 family)
VRLLVAAGALECALAVALGAFGAHALAGSLDARSLALWETAARYLAYSGLGALAAAAAGRAAGVPAGAVALLLGGGALFAGTVAALALGSPRWVGAVTPAGGLAMIVGFVWIAAAAWRAGG